ncbi:MAG: hypothetical protein K6A33_13750 [Clostridiales bacterium]|nr:hypothetical protein [Clostridiales bacterium]
MRKRNQQVKRAGRVLTVLLAAALLLCCAGCAKENKYVNVGVEMSTAGMSLYLTNTVNGFQRISNYVFFSPSSTASLDKLRQEKQGIDITYLPAEDLGLIKAGDGLTVVFPDCFGEDGTLKGVWVARNSWLENAPHYSYKFILGLAMSADYRASHRNMSYADALESVRGVRDIDWEKYPETMQYCAVYALSNKEELRDEAFAVRDAKTLLAMFEGFPSESGEGYDVCREAYARVCGSDAEPFENLFDFSLAVRALEEAAGAE